MANLDKVWVVGESILPEEHQVPTIDGLLLLTSPNFEDFSSRVSAQERITLITEDLYAKAIQKNYGDRIEAIRVGINSPSPQLFEEQLHSLRDELRQIHDFSVAEDVAWSGGIATEAKVIRRITEAMIQIFTCNDNGSVQKCLFDIIRGIAKVKSAKLYVDPPYAPLAELKNQDFAIPIQFEGKLHAHLYVKLSPCLRNREIVIEELSEFLLGLSDVIALTLERNRVLLETIRSRHLWQASFDAIEDPVLIIDSELIVLQANRSYLELVDKPIDEVRHKACPLFQMDEIASYMKFPRSEWELTYNRRNYRVFLDHLHSKSEEQHFVIRMQDFTREKSLRETMLAKEQRSHLGVLISSVAHDINNPIGGILAYCQLLEKDYPATSEIGTDIQIIKEEATRCQNVIQTMLSLVRASNSSEESYSVSECIVAVLSLLGPELKRSNIDIEWQDETLIRYDLPKVWGQKEKTLQAIFQSLQELVSKLKPEDSRRGRKRAKISITTEIGHMLRLRFATKEVANASDLEQSVSYHLSSILLEEQGGSMKIRRENGIINYDYSFPLSN